MKHRLAIQVVAAVVVGVFAIGIWASGDKVDVGWLRFFSAAVLAAVAVLALWDRVLWKRPLFQRIRGVPRNLGGTWKGTLTSFWTDPQTGKPPAPKPAYLVIRQTVSAVSVALLTDESRSMSSYGVVSTVDGAASLDYIYLNRPDSRVEHRSRMHHGSASLDITGCPATRLRGRYWTDRDSRGELDFTARSPKTADDFDEAQALFS
jgi:hypothetical protein